MCKLLRRQLCFEGLGKLDGLRGVLHLGQLAEHVGVDRVGLGALALGEQLGNGKVGAVLAVAGGLEQVVQGFCEYTLPR